MRNNGQSRNIGTVGQALIAAQRRRDEKASAAIRRIASAK